ncbi:hypothetical protein LTR62_007972 [Meristemomyces frigidus]|uniref:Uncharacterized protein n=1 Tax=Meristemomyces frigidus TaxID=1508187 RepID=A0AAN7TV32_9PEZI|nr:hypothetical protein LTR62_007972 [Meristemomyces frigidus]
MVFFKDTPFFSTGDQTLDQIFAFATLTTVSLALLNVLGHINVAFSQLGHARSHGRKGTSKAPQALWFFALATVSMLVAWREEYPGVPFIGKTQKQVRERVISNVQESIHFATSDIHLPHYGQATNGIKHAFESGASAAAYATQAVGSAAEKEKKASIDDVTAAVKQSWFYTSALLHTNAKQAPQDTADAARQRTQQFGVELVAWWNSDEAERADLAKNYPWMKEYVMPTASLWDSFHVLIDNQRHFWWAQQWFAGYLTWALYVGLECQRRGFRAHLALSLVIIGYTVSLATAQSIFFGLLLLRSDSTSRTGRAQRTAHMWTMLVPIVLEMVILARVPGAFSLENKQTQLNMLNAIQLAVMAIPALGAEILHNWVPTRSRQRESHFSPSELRRALVLVWWSAGVLSLALQINTTYWAYRETDPILDGRWWNLGLDRSSWSSRSRIHLVHSLGTVLGSLGDHAWLNAIGWDVLLSAISISAWAWISSVDPAGILKCSLVPFDVLGAAGDAVENAMEMAAPVVDDVQQRVEPYTNAVYDYVSDVMEAAEPWTDGRTDLAEDDLKKLGQSMESNGLTVDNLARGAQRSVSYSYSALGAASMRTLRRASEYMSAGNRDDDNEHFDSMPSEDNKDRARSPKERGRPSRKQSTNGEDDEDWQELRSKKSRSPVKSRGRPPANGKDKPRAAPVRLAGETTLRRSPRARSEVGTDEKAITHALGMNKIGKAARQAAQQLQDVTPSSHDLGLGKLNAEGAEAAGLTFSLFAVGGLGLASAGVFGAEQIGSNGW